MGSLLGSPYVLLGALILGFIGGFSVCWPIGTFRVNQVQIENYKNITETQNAALNEQKQVLKEWSTEATKNAADAKEIMDEQRQINDTAIKAQLNLQNSLVGIQNVARNLVPLNCKLDNSYQQLLDDITKTANSNTSNPTTTKTTVAPRNSKLHPTVPKP